MLSRKASKEGKWPTFSKIRSKSQSGHWHIFDGFGVEAKDAEIVDRVTIHWIRIGFFVIVEDDVAREWSGTDDVTIRDDQAVHRVNIPLAHYWNRGRGRVNGKVTHPLSASTTKPVASLAHAASVSKEQVWQKRIDTTHRTTCSIVACHSAVSACCG